MPKVKLGDVAREYKSTIKDTTGLPVVGLEHLTSGEIILENWDEGCQHTFTKGFKAGQMLFGRRRAYLKKAALAPFDGVCSGDIIVIEPIPEKIVSELLPFIIQNDLLFDFAVGKSAGSLSPRVKWSELKEYEFQLPDLNRQPALVELLKSAHAARKAYQRLVSVTDDLVKSQFIEMFDSYIKGTNILPLKAVSDMVTVGIANSATHAYSTEGIIMLRNQNIHKNYLDSSDLIYITPEFAQKYKTKALRKDDILVIRTGYPGIACLVPEEFEGCQTFTTLIVRLLPKSPVTPEFVCRYINSEYGKRYVQDNQAGCAQQNFGATALSKMPIPIPPLNAQMRFAEIAAQADKSKFELNKSIESISNMIKSLMQQDFGE